MCEDRHIDKCPVGPRWTPCCPNEPCYLGNFSWHSLEGYLSVYLPRCFTARAIVSKITVHQPSPHIIIYIFFWKWWRYQMGTFSAQLALCAGISLVTGELPAQRPVMQSFYVFFDLLPNKRLSKRWKGWWFETPSGPSWRHCKDIVVYQIHVGPKA